MKHDHPTQTIILPYAVPASPYRRLLLFGLRRMAAGGINDAHAAHAFFTGFGLTYRRPLILLRALMAEVSRISTQRLTVAPCCCPRMTEDEALLIGIIATANGDPDSAHRALTRLLHVRTCLGALGSAQAVSAAFADCGMPLDDCTSCNSDEAF
jgi:hypothetical protein